LTTPPLKKVIIDPKSLQKLCKNPASTGPKYYKNIPIDSTTLQELCNASKKEF